MEIQPKQAIIKGPAETFTGDVWFDIVTSAEDYPRMRVNVVRFAPGAYTAVFDFETDLDHISDAYAAMDERRAIKSMVRVGSI